MNELIKINYDGERQTTSARTLWEFLDKPHGEFMKWFSRYAEYGFIENVDFRVIDKLVENPQGGRPATDYEITIDMAKELCMLQKTEKGKQARQYFIDLEKQWNSPEAIMSRALAIANKTILALQTENNEMKPKAESFDSLISAEGLYTLSDAAKILNYENIGPKKIFKVLEDEGFLFFKNGFWHAKQIYIDDGHFVQKTRKVDFGDKKPDIYIQVFVTPKGLDMLDKHFRRNGFKKNKEIC